MTNYRVAVEGTGGNQELVNVFHVWASTGIAEDIATAWESDVKTAYLNVMCSAYHLVQVVVTQMDNHNQYTLSTPGTGQNTLTEMLPPQCAAVISWKTNKAGRAFRGRTYVPGIGEADQNAGVWLSGCIDKLETLATALRVTWPNTFNGQLTVYHTASDTYDAIISHVVRPYVYTQRRRTVGRGA